MMLQCLVSFPGRNTDKHARAHTHTHTMYVCVRERVSVCMCECVKHTFVLVYK